MELHIYELNSVNKTVNNLDGWIEKLAKYKQIQKNQYKYEKGSDLNDFCS